MMEMDIERNVLNMFFIARNMHMYIVYVYMLAIRIQ